MENLIIRLAENKDINRINELFIQMIKYVNIENKRNGKTVDEKLFQNGYEEGFLENYLSSNESFILVAEFEGQVVGYLSCEEKNKNLEDSFIYLDDFCVDSNFRDNGIGTELLKASSNYALNNSYGKLKLHVDKNNLKSINFYTNLGFNPLSSDNDRIFMEKFIIKENLKTI